MSETLRAAHCRSGERRPWIPSLSGDGLTQGLEVYLSRLQNKHPASRRRATGALARREASQSSGRPFPIVLGALARHPVGQWHEADTTPPQSCRLSQGYSVGTGGEAELARPAGPCPGDPPPPP